MDLQQSKILSVSLVALCLLATSLLPLYFKTLFVTGTGNLMVVNPFFAIPIAVGLYLRKGWAKRAAAFFNVIGAFAFIAVMLLSDDENAKFLGPVSLLAFQVISLLILTRSKNLKEFFEEAEQ